MLIVIFGNKRDFLEDGANSQYHERLYNRSYYEISAKTGEFVAGPFKNLVK